MSDSAFKPNDSDGKIFELTFKPTPSDRELEWDKSKVVISKTDSKGIIMYANEPFINVSGYDEFELMNKPHNIVRHPDMPSVVFKLMWESLNKGNEFVCITKNMSKSGRYYWIKSDIKISKTSSGDSFFTSTQTAVDHAIITEIVEPLYKKLHLIEKTNGADTSENYLLGFLEDKQISFVKFMENLAVEKKSGSSTSTSGGKQVVIAKKKGFFSGFFADNNTDD